MHDLASLWIHRRVLTTLARQDLRRTCTGTAAGVAWAVLPPIPLLIFWDCL